jgi:gluconate 2-dehydrogenase gamma chain
MAFAFAGMDTSAIDERRPSAGRLPNVSQTEWSVSGRMSGSAAKGRLVGMTSVYSTRRTFLVDAGRAVTSGWLALPLVAALADCARDGTAVTGLTPAEARTMRAFAAQILPADDDTPGADEMGVVGFIDRALGLPFFADKPPVIRAGLADLDRRARALDGSSDFATLGAAQQIEIMQQVEHEPFFAAARMLVVSGTFADPSYGGNTRGAGWAMLGLEHQPSYTAPFGWYDARAELT